MSALRDALRDLPEPVFADVFENDDAYLLVLDLPGATEDTVDIRATDNRLQIEVRREKDVSREFRFLSEERSLFLDVELPFPPTADLTAASATIERGVLELTVPKYGVSSETTIPVRNV